MNRKARFAFQRYHNQLLKSVVNVRKQAGIETTIFDFLELRLSQQGPDQHLKYLNTDVERIELRGFVKDSLFDINSLLLSIFTRFWLICSYIKIIRLSNYFTRFTRIFSL